MYVAMSFKQNIFIAEAICIQQVPLTNCYIIFGHMLLILVCAVLSCFTPPQEVNKLFKICLKCDKNA